MGNFPLISFCCARNDIYHKDGKSVEGSDADQLEPYCMQTKVKAGSDKGIRPESIHKVVINELNIIREISTSLI